MKKLFFIPLLLCALTASAQSTIKVNQVGYYPSAHKSATLEGIVIGTTTLKDSSTGEEVWSSKAGLIRESPFSDKKRTVVDFSEVTRPGTYTLTNGNNSTTVSIRDKALSDLATAGMKAFYLQRSGEPILEEYAGVYARPMGHPDTCVIVHASAATEERPEGTIISSPRGWYDAGDYNKYIVNSAFTISLMLYAYEMYPVYFLNMATDIPESKNDIPDFFDEIMVNLRWMQTMQDTDGGVYHKLTTPEFEGFVMPVDCHQPRYVVMKTTAATLDFAATMAQASRLLGNTPEYAEWAEGALAQAIRAYEWAEAHPNIVYNQAEMNEHFAPKINTGEYADTLLSDEFLWASEELYRATREEKYNIETSVPREFIIPTWDKVSGLALYALICDDRGDLVEDALTRFLAPSLESIPTSAFDSPYGNEAKEFCWGSNAESCAGLGFALLFANFLTHEEKYLDAALLTADYLLGRNAVGYCFVTGQGSHSPMNPHQRLSAADGIAAPLPGFLVGGPNRGMQDRSSCTSYTSDLPDEAYTDDVASYASNEVAINWNASLVALIGGIEAAME